MLEGSAVDAYDHIDVWWKNKTYYWNGFTDDQGNLRSQISLLLIGQGEYEALRKGELTEPEIKGYDWGSFEPAHLYWATLMLKNKHDAPFLFRGICKDLTSTLHQEGEEFFKFDQSVVVAASRLSQIMMKRHGHATEVGQYRNKYPIYAKPIGEIPMLQAFLCPPRSI